MNERFCCQEHIEIALDDFVDHFQQAPEMERSAMQQTCHFCSRPATYHLYQMEE